MPLHTRDVIIGIHGVCPECSVRYYRTDDVVLTCETCGLQVGIVLESRDETYVTCEGERKVVYQVVRDAYPNRDGEYQNYRGGRLTLLLGGEIVEIQNAVAPLTTDVIFEHLWEPKDRQDHVENVENILIASLSETPLPLVRADQNEDGKLVYIDPPNLGGQRLPYSLWATSKNLGLDPKGQPPPLPGREATPDEIEAERVWIEGLEK